MMRRSSHQKFLRKSQKQIEELWPASIVIYTGTKEDGITGQTYRCASLGKRGSQSLDDGGMVIDVDLVLRVDKDILEAEPKEGWVVRFKGEDYRIIEVLGFAEPAWTVKCESADAS